MTKKGLRIEVSGPDLGPEKTTLLNNTITDLGGEWRANELRTSKTTAEAIFDESISAEKVRIAIIAIFTSDEYEVKVFEDSSI